MIQPRCVFRISITFTVRDGLFVFCSLSFFQTLPVKQFKLNIAKKEVDFFETSFKPYGLSCMSNPAFLSNVIEFGKMGKDKINEETIEFLVPYLDICLLYTSPSPRDS